MARVGVGRSGPGFCVRNTWLRSWCLVGSLGASCLAGHRPGHFMLIRMTSLNLLFSETQPFLFLLPNTVLLTPPLPLQ